MNSGADQQVAERGFCSDTVIQSDIAIVPFPALGDITVYLRLAWIFCRAGARVTFFSNALYPARAYFPWLQIVPEDNDELAGLSARCDLVIACFEKYYHKREWVPSYAQLENVAFVTAKKISRDSGLDGRPVKSLGRTFTGASRAFCLDSGSRKTMVDWVDSYAKEVFGLSAEPMPCPALPVMADSRLILIFPTTPQQKKNYWLSGFCWLARRLKRNGWQVEFVCMPHEEAEIGAQVPGFRVRSFPDIRHLMEHVAQAHAVISNDSGGGHLASLMNLPTYTVTRRHAHFAWRPGFNEKNTVIYPWFRFKSLKGRYVWRPFVPIWRIIQGLGRAAQPAGLAISGRTNTESR